MKTKTIKQMEAQFARVCKWCFNETELTETWLNRLATMIVTTDRYRRNSREYIAELRKKHSPLYNQHEDEISIPASVYTKQV